MSYMSRFTHNRESFISENFQHVYKGFTVLIHCIKSLRNFNNLYILRSIHFCFVLVLKNLNFYYVQV